MENSRRSQKQVARIAQLNDAFRINPTVEFGEVMISDGIEALGEGDEYLQAAVMTDIRAALKGYRPQDDELNPLHDFGVLRVSDRWIFWKINAYNKKMRRPSKDPANPAITRRRLTLKLAQEC